MITTTSSFNRASVPSSLYAAEIRRHLGQMIIYFIIGFIFFPLQYMLAASKLQYSLRQGGPTAAYQGTYTRFLRGNGGIYTDASSILLPVMLIAVSILFSVQMFSYLHQKKATDLYHALPVRRGKLLLAHWAAGATLVSVPLVINYLIVIIAGVLYGFENFSLAASAADLIFHLCCALAIIAVCALVSVLTGTTFDNLAYACGALFGIPAILYLVLLCGQAFLLGFTFPDWADLIPLLSPAILPIYMQFSGASSVWADPALWRTIFAAGVLWAAAGAALLFLAAKLYAKRKSELAGKTGYTNALTVSLKLAGAFAGGIAMMFLISTSQILRHVFPRTLAAIFGGAFVYCVLESITARGFKTLKKSLPFIGIGMALPALAVLITGTGGLGYETRIPAAEHVQSVEITSGDRYGFRRYDLDAIRKITAEEDGAALLRRGDLRTLESYTLSQPESLGQINSLHRGIVRSSPKKGTETRGYYQFVSITYHMKNGMKVRRRYTAFPPEMLWAYQEVQALPEFKEQSHPIFSFDAQDIGGIAYFDLLSSKPVPLTLNEDQTQALIEALRADMRGESVDDMRSAKQIGSIVLTPDTAFARVIREIQVGNSGRYNGMFDWDKPARVPLPQGTAAFADCAVLLTQAYTNTLAFLQQAGYNVLEMQPAQAQAVYAQVCVDNAGLGGVSVPRYYAGETAAGRNMDFMRDAQAYTEFTSAQDIKLLLSAASADRMNGCAVLQDSYLEESRGSFASIEVTAVSGEGENSQAAVLYVDPRALPREMLEKMRDGYLHTWGGPEEFFDRILDAVDAVRG